MTEKLNTFDPFRQFYPVKIVFFKSFSGKKVKIKYNSLNIVCFGNTGQRTLHRFALVVVVM